MKGLIITFIAFFLFSDSVFAKCKDVLNEVLYKDLCTKIRTYESKNLAEKPILIIALHGDTAPWDFSFAQYSFAERVAANITNVVAIGMLRPGYIDLEKRKSDGAQGEGIGDNYGDQRVIQISGSIRILKNHYRASKVVLVGQSGGAATVANIIGLYPDLIDHALLISCPCDINLWRKNMYNLTKKSVFKGNLNKVSPIDVVDNISDKVSISILAGNNDLITPPSLIRKYQSALTKAGKDVRFRMIEGDHEIFLSKDALNEVSEVVISYNKALQRPSRCNAALVAYEY